MQNKGKDALGLLEFIFQAWWRKYNNLAAVMCEICAG